MTDLQLNELEEYNELPNNLEEPSRSDGPSKEEQMICELMQFGGYDQVCLYKYIIII